MRAQRLADIASVGVRETDVEHEQVGRLGREDTHRVAAGGGDAHLEALCAQRTRQHRLQLLIVLADSDVHTHSIAVAAVDHLITT